MRSETPRVSAPPNLDDGENSSMRSKASVWSSVSSGSASTMVGASTTLRFAVADCPRRSISSLTDLVLENEIG